MHCVSFLQMFAGKERSAKSPVPGTHSTRTIDRFLYKYSTVRTHVVAHRRSCKSKRTEPVVRATFYMSFSHSEPVCTNFQLPTPSFVPHRSACILPRIAPMKLRVYSAVLALVFVLITGATEGSPCDTSGGSSTYTEKRFENNVNVRNYRRQIEASGCPNHDNTKTSTGHDAQSSPYTLYIPANPSLETSASRTDLTNTDIRIGVTLNGVAIRSCFDGSAQCTSFSSSAASTEASDIDACGGQADTLGE